MYNNNIYNCALIAFFISCPALAQAAPQSAVQTASSSTPYRNCTTGIEKQILQMLDYSYQFKSKEKDCLVIDDHQALFAISLPIEQKSPNSPYLLRVYLVDYKANRTQNMLQKEETLYFDYQLFDGIHFDTVHFSTLANKHVIGLRHNWSAYQKQTNSGSEYLELIEIQNNNKLRFVLNDLPTQSQYFSRGECPSNQAQWGAKIDGIIRLSPKQHNGLQDLIFKQTYTHNEAHKHSGCVPTKNTQHFQFTLPFDGTKYSYSAEDLMQIDAI